MAAVRHWRSQSNRSQLQLATILRPVDCGVVNDISRHDIGFDVDANEVTILTASRNGSTQIDRHHVPRASKAQIAVAILDAVESLRDSR